MNVTLVDYTEQAARMLVLAKSTRLQMDENLLVKIGTKPMEEILEELEYISNTVPSAWEFVHYTFLIQDVSRAFTHQFVRTRTGSYAQQTLRVSEVEDVEERFVYPPRVIKSGTHYDMMRSALWNLDEAYQGMLEAGAAPEDARAILPTNTSTNILASYNLRSLSQLIQSRSGGRTQDEYRNVVEEMADAVLRVHPWADKFLFKKNRDYFADIEQFAEREFGGDLKKKGELLKIVDKMRAEK